tara:strand:+ start:471 stop:899 length:429 start_codon:yes stop_codon:yes gene_type:complete
MANFTSELETYLAGLTTVGNSVANRIRPEVLEQNETLPALTYNIISADHDRALSGPIGKRQTRVQIDCYASTQQAAETLANEIRLEMDGYRGEWGTVFVNEALLERSFSARDAPDNASDDWRFATVLEFMVIHSEPTLNGVQ